MTIKLRGGKQCVIVEASKKSLNGNKPIYVTTGDMYKDGRVVRFKTTLKQLVYDDISEVKEAIDNLNK